MRLGLWFCCCAAGSGMMTRLQCQDRLPHMQLHPQLADRHALGALLLLLLSSSGSPEPVAGLLLTRKLQYTNLMRACCTHPVGRPAPSSYHLAAGLGMVFIHG